MEAKLELAFIRATPFLFTPDLNGRPVNAPLVISRDQTSPSRPP
jgi:hypothetical protein